jgi:thiaminase/transcriptional activator TenA
MWGFSEIGQRLQVQGMPSEPQYAKWIAMYAAAEFGELAAWCRGLVDRLAGEASPPQRERIAAAFLTSSRYEYLFWDASYRLEQWPV